MPSALREHQHEVMSLDETRSLVFGTEDTGYLTLTRPVDVGAEFRTNDTDRPGEDGRIFGRDYIGGKARTFEIGVLTDQQPEAESLGAHRANLDYLNALETFWLDPAWRRSPWAMAVLRSHEAGQTWRCYGRPSRYDETAGRLTIEGYTPVGMEFRLVDNCWYSDVEQYVDVPLMVAPEGGFISPFVFPLTSSSSASTEGDVTVGGTQPTWPIVEFHGPVADPSLLIGVGAASVTIGLDTFINENDAAVVDTRPWVRTVTRLSDGASLAGRLSRDTQVMSRLQMSPGQYQLRFTGNSLTGTAWVRTRWRNARARP